MHLFADPSLVGLVIQSVGALLMSALGFVLDGVNLTRNAELVGSRQSTSDSEFAVRGVHTRRALGASAWLEQV